MFSTKLICMVVIFSCICRTIIYSFQTNQKALVQKGETQGCWFSALGKEALKMPITLTTGGDPLIIHPDSEGNLTFQRGETFKLLCARTQFMLGSLKRNNLLEVECVGGDELMVHDHGRYRYAQLNCKITPKSEVKLTNQTCKSHVKGTKVVSVGFRANYGPMIVLYKVCFDRKSLSSLYSWHVARTPYHETIQTGRKRPLFFHSMQLYGTINLSTLYGVGEQRKNIGKVLKSNVLGKRYIQLDQLHSLARGHYVARSDFFYSYEQTATFHYVNTAPQWQILNVGKWAAVEKKVRSKLINSVDSLVLSGSHGSCKLPDVYGVNRPLYLDQPKRNLPVPLYFWKAVYNIKQAKGVVYVALNNPYLKVHERVYICPNTCPEGFRDDKVSATDAKNKLIYCCSMQEFEKVYGKFDLIGFMKN